VRAAYGFNRRRVLGGTALAAAGLLTSREGVSKQGRSHNGLARIDGIGVYYEVHGVLDRASVPLVLLHGGALTIEVAFTPELIARFARRQPVIAIEQQGHGHTADRPERPMTLDQMIRDTAGVLAHLKVKQADLFGHSLGGMIATGVAIRHPEIVRNVTTLGAPYQLEGFREDLVRIQRDASATPSPELIKLLPTEADFTAWRSSFQRVAPDPKAFDSALERLNTMLTNWTGWSHDELRAVRAPTLIAIGDNDYVRVAHAAEVARLIPNSRLAVLPGTTHFGVVKRDAWLEPMMQAMAQPEL
jgi:pimeloyl-ACP methyl ester carboxylesterase